MASAGLATTDYEKEYDNRGRVPEHPEIFARWDREAAAYRAAARGAEFGLAYGPSPRQTIDLLPAKDDDAQTPLALFIHGGWWRSLDPAMFSQSAAGPERARHQRRGRRLRLLSARFDRHHHRADAQRLSVPVAQAAPAHLRLRPFGRRTSGRLHAGAGLEGLRLRRAGRSGAGGLCDLRRVRSSAVDATFRRTPICGSTRRKRARVSPLHWKVPAGRTLDAVVGALKSGEFLRQSRDDRRELGRARRGDALPGNRRRQSFYRGRSACRPQQRHDETRRANGRDGRLTFCLCIILSENRFPLFGIMH